MMKKKIGNMIKKHGGMTLVESLVGMALVVLFGAGIFTSIMLAQRVMINGDNLERANHENVAVTAKDGNQSIESTAVTVTVGGKTMAIAGTYRVSGNVADPENPENIISFKVKEKVNSGSSSSGT